MEMQRKTIETPRAGLGQGAGKVPSGKGYHGASPSGVSGERRLAAAKMGLRDITKQRRFTHPADDGRFSTWRLPTDIRDFTADLLRLYLKAEKAENVAKHIAASGLQRRGQG
ncbi:MAG TPA: hypothetical protein VGY58_08010 [Gemmataceae bacterium]|nr:hypothetical protein [Gemmataceae bacterium]